MPLAGSLASQVGSATDSDISRQRVLSGGQSVVAPSEPNLNLNLPVTHRQARAAQRPPWEASEPQAWPWPGPPEGSGGYRDSNRDQPE